MVRFWGQLCKQFFSFSISLNTNRTLYIASTASIPNDGQWHHVAVVHTGGVNMKFYIDAVLAATVAYTNGAGHRADALLTIGAASEDTNWFTGYLDRIRFDQRALAPGEFDFPAIPQLGIRRNGNTVALSWLSAATNYTLQATEDLSAPNWTNVSVQSISGSYQTNSVITNGARFFRLRP